MDAFSSVEVPVTVTDNCNKQPQPTPVQQQPPLQKVVPPENVTPVIETPPVTTNKTAKVKTIIKNKVDVTSIVKNMSKNIKPFVAPDPVAAPVMPESQDETDKAVTEQLLQVKNEASIKANSTDTNDNQVVDKNTIRYKKGQWSPINTAGKRIYDRDFLICLQNNPKCKKKPENLPELDVVLKDSNKYRILDNRSFSMNCQSEVLVPAFSHIRGCIPRKDDRLGGSVGGSDRKRRNNATDDGGWSMATSRGPTPYTVESSKLMNKAPPIEEMTLGSKNLFGQLGYGGNIKTQIHTPVTNTANAVLEKILYTKYIKNFNSHQNKSRPGSDSRLEDPYVPKEPSMERSRYKQNYEDGRGSRSGSQYRNTQQHRPTPSPSPSMKREQQPPPPQPQPQMPQLTPEQLKLKMRNIMEEYLYDCTTLKDCIYEVKQSIEPSKMPEFVSQGYNDVLDCSTSIKRLKAGKLYAHLIKNNILTHDDYLKSLKELLLYADDLVIDIPKLWDYLAEMIVSLITEDVLTLDRLAGCMDVLLAQKHSHKLLAQLLKQLFIEKGPGYVMDIWQSSGVSFTDFMAADYVNSFIKENKFDFMMQGSLSWVHNKLLQFLKSGTTFDTITDWITANVGDRSRDNHFIRILVTAICENAVHSVNNTKKLRIEIFAKYCPLLQRYINNQEAYELQCLFALQSLVHKWDHPPGLLLPIFERLWEDGHISKESLLAWESNTDPAEQDGKTVAQVALQRLFTALNEPEEESQTSTSDEE